MPLGSAVLLCLLMVCLTHLEKKAICLHSGRAFRLGVMLSPFCIVGGGG